jgi:hypothetical protein
MLKNKQTKKQKQKTNKKKANQTKNKQKVQANIINNKFYTLKITKRIPPFFN